MFHPRVPGHDQIIADEPKNMSLHERHEACVFHCRARIYLTANLLQTIPIRNDLAKDAQPALYSTVPDEDLNRR